MCNAWGKTKMANVKKAVRSKEMGLKKKSKVTEVLRSTLKNKVKSKETVIQKVNTRLSRQPELPYHLEEELISYCLMMERKYFGLTK